MEQTLAEFKNAQKHKSPKGKSKVNNSWGVYDYYKFYRVHRPDLHEYVLCESTYFAIIRKVNKLLVEDLCKTGSIEFPHRMGSIVIYKKPVKTYIYNGKPVTTKKINWDKTLELWYYDVEARERKDLVYHDKSETLKIKYDKSTAIYKNKYYYEFTLCRAARDKVRRAFYNRELALQEVFDRTQFDQIKGLYDE